VRRLVVDACALINLFNGHALELVLALDEHTFAVGPIVLGECAGELRPVLEHHIARAALQLLDDDLVPVGSFAALLARFRLGDGETECLAFAELAGLDVCTDDGAARKAVRELLGEDRLTGSLGLLRTAVGLQRLAAAEAYARYLEMVAAGGFLPVASQAFFSV
jgi:predicted nucleic acid-binding protein